MSLALIRLFLGSALKKLIAWLSHRSFWQLMFGAALLFAGVQTVRVWAEQRHAHKVEAQLSKSKANPPEGSGGILATVTRSPRRRPS